MDTLPEISLGSAVLIIFGLCAGYMFIRGLFRTFVNVACLTVSAWVGFRVWQQAPSLAKEWLKQPSELVSTGLPILAFVGTFLVIRKLIKVFRSPIPKDGGDDPPKSSGSIIFKLLATIIPAGLVCVIAATFVHHVSSVAEIRNSAEFGAISPPKPSLAERLKNSISVAIPPSLMDKLDPLTAQPRLQLAKMIAASPDKPLEPVIDPSTGRPYPRAIIVDDPELIGLAKQGRFSTLLRHPLLSEALKDPLIRQALGL